MRGSNHSSSDHDLLIVIIRRQGKRVTCLIRVVGLMQVLPLFFATYEMQGTPYIFTVRARGIRTNQHLSVVSVSRNTRGSILHTSLDDFRCTDAPTYA